MVFQKKSAKGPAAFGKTLQFVGDGPASGQQQFEFMGGGNSSITPIKKTGRSRGDIGRGQPGIGRGRGEPSIEGRDPQLDVVTRAKWGCAVGSDAVFGPSSTRYVYTPQAFQTVGKDAPFRPRFATGLGGYWTPFNLLTLVDILIQNKFLPLMKILATDPTRQVKEECALAFAYKVGSTNSTLKGAGPWAALLPITVEYNLDAFSDIRRRWANSAEFASASLGARVSAMMAGRQRAGGTTLESLVEFQEGLYEVWKMRDNIISTLLTKFTRQIANISPMSEVSTRERKEIGQIGIRGWLSSNDDRIDQTSLSLIRGSISLNWGLMFTATPQASTRTNSCVFNERNTRSGGRVAFPAGDLLAAATLKAVGQQVPRQVDVIEGMPVSTYADMWAAGGGITQLIPKAPPENLSTLSNPVKVWGLYTNIRLALKQAPVRSAIGTGELLGKVFKSLPEKSKKVVVKFLASSQLSTSEVSSIPLRVEGMRTQSPSTDTESFLNAILLLDLGCLDTLTNDLRGAIRNFSMWVPQRALAVKSGEYTAWEGLLPLYRTLKDRLQPHAYFEYVNVLPSFHNVLTNSEGPYMVWSESTPYLPIYGGDDEVISIDGEDGEVTVIEDPLEPEPFPREVVEQVMGTPLFTMIADHVGVDLKAQVEVIAGNAHNWGVPAQGVMSYLILASHYNTKPIEEVNSLFTAGFESTLSADESLQQTFQKVGGALQQYQDGTLSDAQLLSYFNQRGSLQAGKQTDEGLSTTTKIILGVGGAGALYFLYNKFIKSDDV
jgi:hypothetical protein